MSTTPDAEWWECSNCHQGMFFRVGQSRHTVVHSLGCIRIGQPLDVQTDVDTGERDRPTKEGREDESQELPKPNTLEDVQTRVMLDIEQRRQVGIDRYGVPLQPHNGRRADVDLYEELLDAVMYQKQRMIEQADYRIVLESIVQMLRRGEIRIEENGEDKGEVALEVCRAIADTAETALQEPAEYFGSHFRED